MLFSNQAEAMLMDLEFMKQPTAATATKLENKENKVVLSKDNASVDNCFKMCTVRRIRTKLVECNFSFETAK